MRARTGRGLNSWAHAFNTLFIGGTSGTSCVTLWTDGVSGFIKSWSTFTFFRSKSIRFFYTFNTIAIGCTGFAFNMTVSADFIVIFILAIWASTSRWLYSSSVAFSTFRSVIDTRSALNITFNTFSIFTSQFRPNLSRVDAFTGNFIIINIGIFSTLI